MICVTLDTPDSILLLSSDRSFHALYHILQQLDKQNNIWYSDSVNKNLICKELSCSMAALEKMIKSLRDKNLLDTISRGKYSLSKFLIDY
jgi:recombinational DNA repair protein RecR